MEHYYCKYIGATSIYGHVLTDKNPFINKAIHVLLLHGFANLFTLVPGRHAKHMLSLQINMTKHENLTTTWIEHIYHVRFSKQCKWVVKLKNKVHDYFLHFRCVFVEFMQ